MSSSDLCLNRSAVLRRQGNSAAPPVTGKESGSSDGPDQSATASPDMQHCIPLPAPTGMAKAGPASGNVLCTKKKSPRTEPGRSHAREHGGDVKFILGRAIPHCNMALTHGTHTWHSHMALTPAPAEQVGAAHWAWRRATRFRAGMFAPRSAQPARAAGNSFALCHRVTDAIRRTADRQLPGVPQRADRRIVPGRPAPCGYKGHRQGSAHDTLRLLPDHVFHTRAVAHRHVQRLPARPCPRHRA